MVSFHNGGTETLNVFLLTFSSSYTSVSIVATFHDSYLNALTEPGYVSRIVNNDSGRHVTGKHFDGTKFQMQLSVFEIVTDGVVQYAGKSEVFPFEMRSVGRPNDYLFASR
jgi:hypothetical protein